MKKLQILPVLVLFLALSFSALAQAPHFMSYQAVVRNASNNLVVNANVGVKVTILQGTATGTVVFEETHLAMTNANGLATLAIGNGTNMSGSIATIAWTGGPYFIKTEVDPAGGINYTIASTTQMMSVPYALYAETSGSSTPGPVGPEGPVGPTGPIGPAGPAGSGGMDVNCLQCHNHNPATSTPLSIATANAQSEIVHSKHFEGAELAIEEGYSAGCAPCHSNEGFHSVVDNNTVPTMNLNATTGKYSFSYNATAANSSALTTMPTSIGCWTCHKGGAADSMALYTTAAVQMTMHPVNSPSPKIINLTADDSQSNLCVKCHQPRPMSTSSTLSNGQIVDLATIAANPLNMWFDSAVGNAAPNKLMPSYRMHNHYGTVGAIFAGVGAAEFAGNASYVPASPHPHSTVSCQSCHMATPTGINGGHSFWVSSYSETGAKSWNFKGCNVSGCHTTMSATSSTLTNAQNSVRTKLNTIASKLVSNGIEFMHKTPDYASNPFAYVTTAGYDGYLDIFDPSTNPDGVHRNPAPATSWTTAQKNANLALPKFTSLLNVQMGAIVNFQMSVREYSLGIHNPPYTNALLDNTIQALEDAGF